MKKMKRVMFLTFALLVLIVFSMYAGAAKEQMAPGEKVNIVWYQPGWIDQQAKQVLEAYAKERPNVLVNVIVGPSTWDGHVTRCVLWIKTKYAGVDIAYMDDFFTLDGAAAGVWEELTPYLSKDQQSDFVELMLEYEKVSGGIHRLPYWAGMSYVYYRKDLFAQQGLAVPKTWDEWLQTGKKLSQDLDGDGALDQWGYCGQGDVGQAYNGFMEFLYQAGGDDFKYAPGGKPDPAAKKALEMMRQVYQTISPSGVQTMQLEHTRAMLKEGKVAMVRDFGDFGAVLAQDRSIPVDVMNFPAGPAGPFGMGHSWGNVVNKNGANFKKHKEAVLDFALFQFRPDMHKITSTLDAPALKSLYSDSAFMKDFTNRNIVAPYTGNWWKYRRVRKTPFGTALEFHEGIGRIVIQTAMTKELTVDQGLAEIQKFIDPLIGAAK
jgi:ABC-type glycerol-3-phosphate transport system substrate-binding protein